MFLAVLLPFQDVTKTNKTTMSPALITRNSFEQPQFIMERSRDEETKEETSVGPLTTSASTTTKEPPRLLATATGDHMPSSSEPPEG